MEQERYRLVEGVLVAAPNEASLRLQVTDLLLNGLRNARVGRLPLEQSDVLQEIEAALASYGDYFYPKKRR
jgi:hypothetical protein